MAARCVDVRPATPGDGETLAAVMREADVAELVALGSAPEVAAPRAIRRSVAAWTARDEGGVICCAGIALRTPVSDTAAPWLLCSDRIAEHPRQLLRVSRRVVRAARERWRLENYVHADNADAIAWLGWLGFTVDPPHPLGPRRALFSRFWMERTPNV